MSKGQRITGASRDQLKKIVEKYYVTDRESIREIAVKTGRSYGSVHRLLVEAGVELRPRGGGRPGKRRTWLGVPR